MRRDPPLTRRGRRGEWQAWTGAKSERQNEEERYMERPGKLNKLGIEAVGLIPCLSK